ncbi:multisubunit sodium/proton antiporter, MrpG subunit [Austwickia chelonae]|uniref:Na(+)/H(+) antiporter subunit G n=1 Tax=Austwickia chelonae NBRC 105200 TaxID=1184607 RepID=K6WAM2_9MICO|nr:monovalent cation/H(+) antiporter subunit G [Austwickia chelonae]GAB78892.1 Na(+)/H(+) antiporter subunit G [Austwickia chelonae NBRC 105200]SEV86012.1 multisubunit sodium/proton antiporter, MrpG subunit [Austwickia chelonae]
MWSAVADAAGLVCLFVGAALCLASAVGLLRLDDLYSRMHAATKPQVLGVLLVLMGIGLRLRDPFDLGMLFLVGVFQLFTIPAAAQMLARAHHRTQGDDVGRAGLPQARGE